MKLDFLNTVPYVCERWTALSQQEPAAVFLTEEGSGTGIAENRAFVSFDEGTLIEVISED